MAAIFYLDESGDLGWSFQHRYRAGGSSRFLTIAALEVPSEKRHLPKRLIKKLYQSCGWDPTIERKWSEMTASERELFAQKAHTLWKDHEDVRYHSITVRKENVQPHIRQDGNKLYNYMIGLLLLEHMSPHGDVHLIPDPRSIKVESGNSLHDYLQVKLWFELKSTTALKTTPQDSKSCSNVQFADMLSGLVQSHMEDNKSPPWDTLNPCLNCKRLFF